MDLTPKGGGRRPAAAKPKFELGRITITPAAAAVVRNHGIDVLWLLARHAGGDWGDQKEEGKRLNDLAVVDGSRILSFYGAPRRAERLLIETSRSTTMCAPCCLGAGECEPDMGEWEYGHHWRTDLPERRLSTCIMTPRDY